MFFTVKLRLWLGNEGTQTGNRHHRTLISRDELRSQGFVSMLHQFLQQQPVLNSMLEPDDEIEVKMGIKK